MARILITGSSDGLGSLAAQVLVKRGHTVYLHARSDQRAQDAKRACPGAESVFIADLSKPEETKKLAEEANKVGAFDCVIHNAGLYRGAFRKTAWGMPSLTMVNSVAPYMLATLILKPKRIVFVSSGLQSGADASLKDWTWQQRGEREFSDHQAYCDSKLHNVLLAFGLARRWPDVESNALNPGWVATKMGGRSAPDDINKAVGTYVMLAEGCGKSGKYFKLSKESYYAKAADNIKLQDAFFEECEQLTRIKAPKDAGASPEL